MKVISYQVTLLEPALLSSLEGDPNESSSFNYIPGSVLRGALIAKYMAAHGIKQLDAADDETRKLFFNGAVRYLNGYPLDRLNKRALPVPLSWKRDKRDAARVKEGELPPVYDLAAITQGKIEELNEPQSVSAPFYSMISEKVQLITPKRWFSIHTARNRRFGRAVKKSLAGDEEYSGAVYRYEALAAGQTFGALILCDTTEDADRLKILLEGEVLLGGSRTAGYGKAVISDIGEHETSWREAGGQLNVTAGGKLIVTLLSDILVRDEIGDFSADHRAITSLLSKKLGTAITLGQAYLKSEITGGFNRKWGLPLPQAPAISMGSVLVYDVCDNEGIDLEKLKRLEDEGIGERKAEGFGRIAFNLPSTDNMAAEKAIHPEAEPTGKIEDPESRETALFMVNRLFQRRLEAKIAARALSIAQTSKNNLKALPSNSQLNRLRAIIADELMNISVANQQKRPPNLERIKEYLKDLESRKAAGKQFMKVRIEGQSLLGWLKETLDKSEEEKWKELLGLSSSDYFELGEDIKSQTDEDFRQKYLLRFIDAVLAALAKERKKEVGQA